jgi:hypothetical protein
MAKACRSGGFGAIGAVVGLILAAADATAQDRAGEPTLATPLGDATLRMGGELRARVEGRTPTVEEDPFEWQALTAPTRRTWRRRLRVWAELHLGATAVTHLELQHAAVSSTDQFADPELDRVDLRQGYLALRPAAWRGVTIRVGRFAVPTTGDGRVLSDDDFGDLGRALDGVQVAWERGPFRLRAMAVNVNEADPLPRRPGAGPDHWLAATIVEARAWPWLDLDWLHVERWFPRAFGSEDPGDRRTGPRVDATLGVRAKLRVGPLAVTGETYGQAGVQGPDRILAAATVERIEWRLFDAGPAPVAFFEHAFASGDWRPTDGVRGTFDPLFPDTHAHLGPYDALGWRNVHALATGVSVSLAPLATALDDWRLTFVARGSFLDRRFDAWYGADGEARLIDPTGEGASSHTLEGELSGWVEGTLLEGRVAVSLGLAHWCPNNWLADLGFHEHGYRVWAQTAVRF